MSVLLTAGLTYNPGHKTGVMSRSDIFELVTTAGWSHGTSGQNSPTYATEVVMAESGGDTAAKSPNPDGGTNVGLFQIDSKNVDVPAAYLEDPVYNANVARRMFVADGMSFRVHWDKRTIAKADAAAAGPDAQKGPSDEAQPVGIGATLGNPLDTITGFIGSLFNASTWFRIGKGVMGFLLIIGGTFSIIFIIANKAGNSNVGRAAKKAAAVAAA